MEDALSNPRLFVTEEQAVQVDDFESSGLILDIGGGGEGVIGRLKGSHVVAIDIHGDELEEAPPGPLKLVMDARAMTFMDASFETVTAFFALMYISFDDLEAVFREAFRVLKPEGRFRVWDAVIPPRNEAPQDVFVIRMNIALPDEHIQTGFGVCWADCGQIPAFFEDLAVKTGFRISESCENGRTFRMVFVKPL